MRLRPIVQLSTAALLTRIVISSGSNKVKNQTSAHFDGPAHDNIPANRLMMAENTMNSDERMPQETMASLVSGLTKKVVANAVEEAMKVFHANDKAYMLTKEAWNEWKELDPHVHEVAVEILSHCTLERVAPPKADEKALHHMILDKTHTFEDGGAKQLMHATIVPNSNSMDEMYRMRHDSTATDGFTSSDVERFASKVNGRKNYESLNQLLIDSGAAPRLAPAVSTGRRRRPAVGHSQQTLRAKLKRWANEGQSVQTVSRLLGSSTSEPKRLTYEEMCILSEYILLYNNKRRTKARGKVVDAFSYFIKKCGDSRLALMILGGTKVPQLVDRLFIKKAIGHGKTPAEFIDTILMLAFDVESLLGPLLAAFGGAAKLAPLLKTVRESGFSKDSAKQLQHAMFLSWLDSGKTDDAVFDLLGLSEIWKSGLICENMNTFVEYISVRNEHYTTGIDALMYLRRKFGDTGLSIIMREEEEALRIMKMREISFSDRQVDESKSSADFVGDLLAASTNVVGLLDPLLIVFGGAAKLAPILSIAKMNPVTREKAVELRHAMLTSWAKSRKNAYAVSDLLELTELKERGLVYENLDFFAEYLVLCNKISGGGMDIIAYLRTQFGDNVLTLTILERKEVSSFTKEFDRALIQRWRDEGKTLANVCDEVMEDDLTWQDRVRIVDYFKSVMTLG
ncbi:unnamed protein product [Hyaloperonospora brassicae]|uniref:RxLR effector candidate protein n=1 Tax=Hyaloperonospora brassicae TaxID=162125 RepID=A0AAV0UB80_HYABA|nr:unnamed protein product [Hyaloperonospora brassicae]